MMLAPPGAPLRAALAVRVACDAGDAIGFGVVGAAVLTSEGDRGRRRLGSDLRGCVPSGRGPVMTATTSGDRRIGRRRRRRGLPA